MGSAILAQDAKPEANTEARPLSKREMELRDAIERVRRRYAGDLSAFLKDIQKERELLKKG